MGVLSDKGSVDDLTLGRADHNQLPHLRRTGTQAVVTLKEEEKQDVDKEEDGEE